MPATITSLLAEIHQKQSVLNGWAAVLSLSEKATVDLVEAQWPRLAERLAERPAERLAERLDSRYAAGDDPIHVAKSGPMAGVSRIELELGPRQLGLDPDRCCLTFSWPPPEPTGKAEALIAGSAPLRLVVDGQDEKLRWLILDFGARRIRSRGGAQVEALAEGLAQSLEALGQLRLARFRLASEQRLRRLQPTALMLHSMTAASGEKILQMLVGTGREPDHPNISLSEPVPTASGADFSLVVDSGIVIRDLVSDFNAEPGLLKLVAVAPSDDTGAWYAQTRNPMSFQSKVSWGKTIAPIPGEATMGMDLKGSTGAGLSLSSYLDSASSLALQLTVTGEFPLQITDDGIQQKVGIAPGQIQLDTNGLAENAVRPQLTSFLEEDLSGNLAKTHFSQATTLLFETLALPAHQPRIDHAHLPADLVFAGRLPRKNERP